jgi:serine/threonine-protein kinase
VSGLPSFVANTTAELCALVLTAEPTPLRASLPDAPAGLDAVIARCLAKNPDQRYGSVAELARALERFGPPQVKTSVERITRMGSALSRAAEKAVEKVELAPVSIVPPGQTSSKISSLGQTELSDSGAPPASMRDVPARAQIPGSGTNAAWGSSQPVTRKSRLALVIAGSVAAALAVLAVIAVATSHSHSPTSVATTPPPPPTTTTAVTTVITTPTATTQATESPAVTTPVATTTQIKPTKPVHTTSPQTTATTKKTGTAPVDTTGFGGRN